MSVVLDNRFFNNSAHGLYNNREFRDEKPLFVSNRFTLLSVRDFVLVDFAELSYYLLAADKACYAGETNWAWSFVMNTAVFEDEKHFDRQWQKRKQLKMPAGIGEVIQPLCIRRVGVHRAA
ncbi:MAG: hypothetical protein LBH00_01935 [Planctomycetaceae bacterium]|nr:hypothetical protein [Planctomycetaceae bacterium]